MNAALRLHHLPLERAGLPDLRSERLEFAALLALAVLVPLVLAPLGSQFVLGTAINAMLVLAALHTRGWRHLLPLILVPSVVVIASGWLIGAPVHVALLLVPFIWAGNAIFALTMKRLAAPDAPHVATTLAIAAAAKTALIAAGAALFVTTALLPIGLLAFLVPMQLVTALLGGSLGWIASTAWRARSS